MDSPHSAEAEEVLESLDSSPEGLSGEEARRRLEEKGRNEIVEEGEIHPLRIFVDQFRDFLIYLLILAAIVSVGVGFLPGEEPEYVDAALIFLILIANGIFGFIQDYKAERSIEALKELSSPGATVLRDGERREIDSGEVVPGDVVIIEQGDSIPADARLLEESSLSTDESALTGESLQVSKRTEAVEEDASLAERTDMVFMNTTAVKGRGKAVVVSTGMDTEVGKIASQISEAEEKKSPFQEEVDELGKRIGYGIMAIIVFVAVTQLLFTNTEPVHVLLVAITLAVAAVPEGLPAVVTLTLALGSKKMLEKNALVRRLPVVESLGSVDVIVTDKTGTLTEDTMTVKKVWFSGEVYSVTGTGTSTEGEFLHDGEKFDPSRIDPLLRCGRVCNNAERSASEDKYFGDPTEVALLISAMKADLEVEGERIREIPFASARKRMTVIQDEGESVAYMKGAPETVLDRCDYILEDGEQKDMTPERRKEVLEINRNFAGDALRVLGFARKKVSDVEADEDDVENGMVFLGLQGMIDPPREEVADAVGDCRDAGIRVIMATGDNIETAKAVGDQVNFSPEGALTGKEVESLTEEELREKVKNVEVFARASPSHKVQILEALQDNGHNVAMTGDGVNDAPALKKSDVGISMGIRGTDVAKESSDMVLQDDNFVTIRDAIAEGRGIFDNIRKFVNYLLSANAGEVLIVFFGILIGSLFFPEIFKQGDEALILTPVMLLWINLVTDGLPALALGADPKSDNIMDRPPRGMGEPVINRRMMASIVAIGIIMTVSGLPVFFLSADESLVLAQTLLFTFLVVVEMVRIQIIRGRYGQSILSNPWLVTAIGVSLALQLVVIYTPLKVFFETVAIPMELWFQLGGSFLAFLGLAYVTSKSLD